MSSTYKKGGHALWRGRPVAKAKQQWRVSGDRLGLGPGRCRDFGREVGFLLLDAFAELEADEAGQLDAGAGLLGRRGHDFGDRGLAVDHEQLSRQRVLLAELG